MKRKNLKGILNLNKKTIANLSNKKMEKVIGANQYTLDTWCEGSCIVPIGEESGCFSHPRGYYCVCEVRNGDTGTELC